MYFLASPLTTLFLFPLSHSASVSFGFAFLRALSLFLFWCILWIQLVFAFSAKLWSLFKCLIDKWRWKPHFLIQSVTFESDLVLIEEGILWQAPINNVLNFVEVILQLRGTGPLRLFLSTWRKQIVLLVVIRPNSLFLKIGFWCRMKGVHSWFPRNWLTIYFGFFCGGNTENNEYPRHQRSRNSVLFLVDSMASNYPML